MSIFILYSHLCFDPEQLPCPVIIHMTREQLVIFFLACPMLTAYQEDKSMVL